MSSLYGQRGATGEMSGQKIPKGYQMGSIQRFTPEQMQLFQSMMQHVGPESFLSKIASGSQEGFEQMEEPAMRQFAGLQGNLASRFSGMGGLGGRRSSGFQNTANQAAANFASDLQSRRYDLQRQAIGDLSQLSNMLLSQQPYEQFLTQKKPSFMQSLLGGIGNLGGQFLGAGAGMGGALGAMNLFGFNRNQQQQGQQQYGGWQ